MDNLFFAFHDELEKISSREKTLTEQRDSARRKAKILGALGLAGAGAGIAESHFAAKARAAEAARKAANRSALSRGAKYVAGQAVGAGLGFASLGLIARSLKRRRPSPELKRLYALPSAKFTHPVAAAPTKATNRKPYYVDEQIRRGRAYEKNKKQEAAKAARQRQRNMHNRI